MNKKTRNGKTKEDELKEAASIPRPLEAEDDLGGGDICSLEQQSSTEDDMPLD